MRNKPYTTNELFDIIIGELKQKNLLPDILDYALSSIRNIPILTYQFSFRNNLGYGGSEGIYIDLWIEYYEKDELIRKELGVIKTLRDDHEAMRVMGTLLADFIVTGTKFVNKNLDDFTWTGWDVYPVDEKGLKMENSYGYTCSSYERAVQKKELMLEKYERIAIRDNALRKQTVFSRAEK